MISISNLTKKCLLIFALFANFNAKIGRNGSKKNQKTYFTNVVRIPFYVYFRSGRLHFVQKSKDLCILLESVLYMLQ
jgi:hypothetical protein